MNRVRITLILLSLLLLFVISGFRPIQAESQNRTAEATCPNAITALVRTVDLGIGETRTVELHDGSTASIKLVDLHETRDSLRNAVRSVQVTLEINGVAKTITSATYHLPVTVAGVQVDCPVTRDYLQNSSKQNAWALEKDARFRLWPEGSAWVRSGSFGYPVRQRWFASDTQMANEPCFVDGGELPGKTSIYYHYGLDFGGAEGLVEVVAATDALIVSAAGKTLPDQIDSPVKPRYDVIYALDGRGWYYRYSHLKTVDVKPGQCVRKGEHLGVLGKEGGSGGWSHLHFDITSRQPSGAWGIQDAYAYAWQAYHDEHHPALVAVARPHHLVAVGEEVQLDGRKSWSATGMISEFHWTFSDGTNGTGPVVRRTYSKPGTYSEILQVTDGKERKAWDFSVVQVLDPMHLDDQPPSIHAVYYPTTNIKPGDAVTFKVRAFRTTHAKEVWDFGDGSAPVRVRSDGNVDHHAKDGYAVAIHRFAKPGDYLVRVERSNERGEKATARLLVQVAAP